MGVFSKGLRTLGGVPYSGSGRLESERPLCPIPVPGINQGIPLPQSAAGNAKTRRRRADRSRRTGMCKPIGQMFDQ